MKTINTISLDTIEVKEIQDHIPFSTKVDTRVFSGLLDDSKMVATYKMYWLLGIIEEVSTGKEEMSFKSIIARMVVYAWYPIRQYKLNFGVFDNLKKIVNYVAEKYDFPPNCDEKKLLDFLNHSEDKELEKMIKELTYNVPYRLLSPFFVNELRGMKDKLKNKEIIKLSLNSEKCLYQIKKEETDKIILNKGWADYLKGNYKVIKAWIYYKIVCFLQKRNPNVPAIAFKLEAPKLRNLSGATKIWSEIIRGSQLTDIYTGKEFSEANYKEYGVLSIDHFIPWSFVLHDQIWNLVPTFKNINSAKSDKLLVFDKYINHFCDIQYKAFAHVCNRKINNAIEEYMDILQLENPYEYLRHSSSDIFQAKIKQCISPLYHIAVNQGFQVVEKLV